jgi:hypothetical protein
MSGEPIPDGVKSISLEVVSDEPPHRNPWRPTILTIRKFLRICHLVEKGFATSRACQCECVSYCRFRARVQRSRRLQERLKQAEDIRFNLRHEEALESIMLAGQRSWLAHAWWLERNLPHLYALRAVARADSEQDEPEPEIPAEVLARHRALMLEQAREDEARQPANRSSEMAG